ncbi:50S ribosomal protein L24 [Blochmannia endosymbiont of Camponotus modoc]|uniref:50S ribosomal protein L24 n=1 Tax=Blochmannia endosymbiont of Camponotus modoc TaxID=2945587 RepID=UPI002025A250|nr:50S ribosomal protein L24 [Blochmannia endosymbiont of Camponotus modoc]URJ26564.1 50S ribosomal protein L24 [Blochmannia endosymbiont of Camponotus modoc]URJ31957.1 50S ribosomal protein L24 [Blochmannia endosymbiont of Camponotus modoc]
MAAAKIKRNDEVIVLSGKDKGKKGKVKCVFYDKGRAIVTGINLVKKHQKPIPNKNQPGGIIEKEASLDLSNIAIFNPTLNKADRVGFTIQNGKKIRIFKSNRDIVK